MPMKFRLEIRNVSKRQQPDQRAESTYIESIFCTSQHSISREKKKLKLGNSNQYSVAHCMQLLLNISTIIKIEKDKKLGVF